MAGIGHNKSPVAPENSVCRRNPGFSAL